MCQKYLCVKYLQLDFLQKRFPPDCSSFFLKWKNNSIHKFVQQILSNLLNLMIE